MELFHLMTQPLKHTSPPGAPLWQLVPISTHETPGEGAVSLQLSITALQPGPQASENHCGFLEISTLQKQLLLPAEIVLAWVKSGMEVTFGRKPGENQVLQTLTMATDS